MYKKQEKDTHSFAFYYPNTSKVLEIHVLGSTCKIEDRVLCHRFMHILRLNKGESFTLFDSHKHMICTLVQVDERNFQAIIGASECNKIFAPHITFMLPLLKREALQEALYSLTELGSNEVQIYYSKKSSRIWGDVKEEERIARIMQSAAEQSKNFAYPVVCKPLPLENAVSKIAHDTLKIFFDPEGCHLNNVISSINTALPHKIVLMIGPEGDLTEEEKMFLNGQNFIFCQLTPTILRAQQAVDVSLGALRSILHF